MTDSVLRDRVGTAHPTGLKKKEPKKTRGNGSARLIADGAHPTRLHSDSESGR